MPGQLDSESRLVALLTYQPEPNHQENKVTNIKDLTKGKTILAANGAEYTILTKAPQTTGTERSEQEPNYLVMVRPAVGRAFDLILTQSSLDSGAYRLKS